MLLVKAQPFKVEVPPDLATQNQLVNWVSEAGNRTQSELNQIRHTGVNGETTRVNMT